MLNLPIGLIAEYCDEISICELYKVSPLYRNIIMNTETFYTGERHINNGLYDYNTAPDHARYIKLVNVDKPDFKRFHRLEYVAGTEVIPKGIQMVGAINIDWKGDNIYPEITTLKLYNTAEMRDIIRVFPNVRHLCVYGDIKVREPIEVNIITLECLKIDIENINGVDNLIILDEPFELYENTAEFYGGLFAGFKGKTLVIPECDRFIYHLYLDSQRDFTLASTSENLYVPFEGENDIVPYIIYPIIGKTAVIEKLPKMYYHSNLIENGGEIIYNFRGNIFGDAALEYQTAKIIMFDFVSISTHHNMVFPNCHIYDCNYCNIPRMEFPNNMYYLSLALGNAEVVYPERVNCLFLKSKLARQIDCAIYCDIYYASNIDDVEIVAQKKILCKSSSRISSKHLILIGDSYCPTDITEYLLITETSLTRELFAPNLQVLILYRVKSDHIISIHHLKKLVVVLSNVIVECSEVDELITTLGDIKKIKCPLIHHWDYMLELSGLELCEIELDEYYEEWCQRVL